ncbi:Lrp/AsnC family transcriptional regulator [cf. Phormidesmis sp. LEGE 11477]|uniref:Lrp/AsnC family transcriptional regulator n=1 Tax=cf. Phormidesmis sp. LEGE 11477 TaxID=1828680 RepID=UPI00187ECE64|nr:Lrp/AsnC family transcriptional regulator [cf. Phormidesmis sp. LEGE 11477]MBE9064966.1 Lrp/AsnC family transcriptional regulator [cf. Phormidesmis sp. LEGE 11477]
MRDTVSKPRLKDAIDQKILDALEENAWLSNEALSKIACLSPSATLRRVQRLTENGVILGAKAIIQKEDATQFKRIILFAGLASDARSAVDETCRVLRSGPGFHSAHIVLGGTDIVAVYNAPSIETFNEWAVKKFHQHGNVARSTTLIALADVTEPQSENDLY